MKSVLNYNIRVTIIHMIQKNPNGIDTRQLATKLSRRFSTPMARIYGNLSTLVRNRQINIASNKPHSIAYL